jgi:sialidase-1
MDEAALTQLANGSVLLNMRHRSSPSVGRGVARSNDGGETWSAITYDKVLISPVCQASIVSFDGATYFSNPASTRSRSHLTVRRSTDDAVTWSDETLVQAGASAGYSCLVKGALANRRGGIVYEGLGEGTIVFSTFPLQL